MLRYELMSQAIETHGVVYNSHKGHDTLYIDPLNYFCALFDGTGGDQLSRAAAQELEFVIPRFEAFRPGPKMYMANIASTLDNLYARHTNRSTAALACAILTETDVKLPFLVMGDSSQLVFNHATNGLKRVAHSRTRYYRPGGELRWLFSSEPRPRRRVDTTKFLGAGRTPDQIEPLVKVLTVEPGARLTLLATSDGLDDLPKSVLIDILGSREPSKVPDAIMSALDDLGPVKDDAVVYNIAIS